MKNARKIFVVIMLTLSICLMMTNGFHVKAKADSFGSSYSEFHIYSRSSEFTITDDGVFSQPYDRMTTSDYDHTPRELSNHFTYITIILEITIAEVNDGYQHIYLYNGVETNSTLLASKQWQHTSGSLNENYITSTIYFNNIPLSDFENNDIVIRYGASGNNDDTWLNKNVYVTLAYSTPVTQNNDTSVAADAYDYLRNAEYTITDDPNVQPYDRITTSDYINAPLSMASSYDYVNITIDIQIKEVNDGYQHITLCNGIQENAKILAERRISHSPGSAGTSYSTYSIDFNSVPIELFTTNELIIKYGASGKNHDNWKNRNVRVMLVYSNSNSELGVNFKYDETLTASQTKSFTCYIPDNLYHVAEARGTTSTTITIIGMGGVTVTSMSSVSGPNARNEFYCSGSGYVMVQLHNNIASTTTTELQVRRQQAVFYGYDYGLTDNTDPLDTTQNAENGYSEFSDIYYSQNFQYNNINNVEHLLGNDMRGYTRLNSEIVMISGHGNSGFIKLPNSDVGNGIIYQNEFGDMSCVKLAIFNTCHSASTYYPYSVIQSAINRGATTAVGWDATIDSDMSREFLRRFFEYLRMGYGVKDSATFIENENNYIDFNENDICLKFKIEGIENLTIVPVNSRQMTNPMETTNAELQQYETRLSLSNDWETIKLRENEYRVYRKVNGYLTTDYYNVTKQNEKVVMVKHSGIIADEMTVLPINVRSRSISSNLSVSNKKYTLCKTKSTIRYINFGTNFVPVETIFCTYISLNGDVHETVFCTNLYDGSEVDYSDICFIRR